MKFTVYLKDPDGFYEGVQEAAEASITFKDDLSRNELDVLVEARVENIWSVLDRWVGHQEYIEIEFDTEAGTARVLGTVR